MHRPTELPYAWATAGRLVAAVIAFVLATPAHADIIRLARAPDDKTIEAIWRVQQLPFNYFSARTSYSCAALKDKIRGILQAVGVHESVEVEIGCNGGGPVSVARAYISFATPVEATQENILAATSFEPHERLAARLKDIALPSATDIERFAASWQRVSLMHLRLRSGDCDLLNGLRRQIFPSLRLRSATGFNCSVSPSRLPPALNVEALVRVQIVRDTTEAAGP